MVIRLAVFDVGETLVNESRMWGEWADWLGVTRLTFFAALGAVIAAKQHHHQVFRLVRPGIDPLREREARQSHGGLTRIERHDLYPDAAPTLTRLHAAGLLVGLAGNQPTEAEAEIRALGLEVDFIASSARWGVEKPDPAFFRRIVVESGVAPNQIAYVGDRLDNDVLPAIAMGMTGVFIRRGPWGVIHATWPEVARADLRLENLEELPEALASISNRVTTAFSFQSIVKNLGCWWVPVGMWAKVSISMLCAAKRGNLSRSAQQIVHISTGTVSRRQYATLKVGLSSGRVRR